MSGTNGHVAIVCTDRECIGCMFCAGGLFACSRCGSFEGATTTDCPGEMMSADQADTIYAGLLDYRDGAWVAQSSRHTPAYWGTDEGIAELAAYKAAKA